MAKKSRLELTWMGKDSRPRLEPRILIEHTDKSHHAKIRQSDTDFFDNILIKGDNLLALKALEQEFSGRVQAIYIDPPFNTGEAFENYDDGLEHSYWLDLMHQRLQILKELLHRSGTLFVHIDDNELGYLIAVCDEIFGRRNRVSISTFKQSSVSGPKSRNPGVVSIANYVLIYAKDKAAWKNFNAYRPIPRDSRYNTFIENFQAPFKNWRFVPLSQGIEQEKGLSFTEFEAKSGKFFEREMEKFVLQNRQRVVQLVSVADKDVNANAREALQRSRTSGQVECSPREDLEDYYFFNGKQIAFYKNKCRKIDGQLTTCERVSNLWDDLLSNNVHKEGGVRLRKGKKPEALIKRCLEISTEPGDLVLDSFLGSGTTAAVAHKMRRQWIGVEIGEQADTHCANRLARVVDGQDKDGITRAVEWKGGGGFRYYTLAPSLIEVDRFGMKVISKDYNPEMLSEAMCKHMGFTYAPSEAEYWNHGHSTETDFIYVTTQSLTHDTLRKISEDVGPDRTLMVCCKAYSGDGQFGNLTVHKIPGIILNKCEWGHDDYSLNVQNLPMAEEEDTDADLPLFAAQEGSND